MSAAVFFLAWSAAPVFASGFVTPEDKASIASTDPKETCIVAGVIFADGIGKFGGVSLDYGKSPLPMTTKGVNRPLVGDGFAFVDVPKGPFRVSMISWARLIGRTGNSAFGNEINEVTAFGPKANIRAPRQPSDTVKAGDVPPEMSGTCNGGFIWLGEFKAAPGGMLVPPSLKLSNLGGSEEPLRTMKSELKGTPWEAAFDARVQNVPLAPGLKVGQAAMDPNAKPTRPKVVVTVKLLSPGDEPRRELRYAATEGAKRPAVVGVITGTKPGSNDLLPQLQFTVDTTTTKVNETAPWKYTYVVTKSAMAPTKDKLSQMIAQNQITNTDGITGFVQFDERGLTWNSDHTFAPGKLPKIGPPISVVSNISNTIIPLPAEPVGAHASWQAELVATGPGFVFTQMITYKLDSLAGDKAKLTLSLAGKTVMTKPIQMGNAKLTGSTVTGAGDAKVDFAKLVPDWYKLASTSTNQFTGSAPAMPPSRTETTLEGK